MEPNEPPDQARFRRDVRAFLAEHADPKVEALRESPMAHAAGSDEEKDQVRRAQRWQALLYDHGWAGITWPEEAGGRGGTSVEQLIFNQEAAAYDLPVSVFAQGIGMAGPTIIAHGTPEQKERFLGPMLRGDELWCQLFSEPNAGSDLASVRTRATRDGDEYVVTGQKVWTSSAHYSDWGILLARTDFDAPKHRGITYFLLDMRTPGIEIRPLHQITGIAHFNEVFLDEVRIPADLVVGEVNGGWRVAMTTLTNERTLIGGSNHDLVGPIRALMEKTGTNEDAVIRDRYARAHIGQEIVRYLGQRVQMALLRGEEPGPESSVLKLAFTRNLTLTADLGLAVAGAAGMLLDPSDQQVHSLGMSFLNQFSSKIGGGTDEIQRNIVAERVLGLPREPSHDRDLPFRELL